MSESSRSTPSPARRAFMARLVLAATASVPVLAKSQAAGTKPTVLLVHGAFAESASWDGVVGRLLGKGFPVVAVANPLRGVASDAAYVASAIDAAQGPVILVGHSYGGSVITTAALNKASVKALVYVAGFAPDAGESAEMLTGKFPGATLGPTLAAPVSLPDGSKDLYIQQSRFHRQFAADLGANQARLMAVAQRPVTDAALKEPSGSPAWKGVPSSFVYGSADRNIPPALQQFMARRAGAKRVVEVNGASHVVMISHPDVVARVIEQAAAETAQ